MKEEMKEWSDLLIRYKKHLKDTDRKGKGIYDAQQSLAHSMYRVRHQALLEQDRAQPSNPNNEVERLGAKLDNLQANYMQLIQSLKYERDQWAWWRQLIAYVEHEMGVLELQERSLTQKRFVVREGWFFILGATGELNQLGAKSGPQVAGTRHHSDRDRACYEGFCFSRDLYGVMLVILLYNSNVSVAL
ncbi:hypothetical protein P152DRAFT_451982 [Eremomyces bilateralis CBS 781.70]|uniref:Uncharacterized protein n=1 Tax=Eremomyces bilateralis CBS 781.70 TaxID=1392243 RepID=A0A6G1FV03_9PEZI|nr:uncharacterized protein P152DRAFT_451982 [Eremomyces bilateralis CBS 781.70]KAF1809536.1 hypothetical protein P152DRAFT_451982 [Eremomyces bilateralis CBS 781.70]